MLAEGSMKMVAPCLLFVFYAAVAFGQATSRNGDAQAKNAEEFVQNLGSDDPAVRERADRELRKLGKAAEEALQRAAESSDPEVKKRAQSILDWLRVLKVDDQGRVLVKRDG